MARLELQATVKQIDSNSFVYQIKARRHVLFTTTPYFLPVQHFDETNAWRQFIDHLNNNLDRKPSVMKVNR